MASVGSQSMVAPLKRVVMKRPEEAFRNAQQIAAQWKDLNYVSAPDLAGASREHAKFVELLRASGTEVLLQPEDSRTGLDSIYTHDASLATEKGVILFQTGKPQRRGEGPALGDALRKWDIPVLGVIDGEATAEGGDMIWLDRTTLIVGRGFRTNAAAIIALRKLLEPLGVKVLSFDLAYGTGPADVLHLMSFMSMLADDLAVVHRPAMPVALYELLQERRIQFVDIPEKEYPTQACNILAFAPRKLIMLRGNPITADRLRAAGCEVHELEGAEMSMKGAGGPTCLTRPILRA